MYEMFGVCIIVIQCSINGKTDHGKLKHDKTNHWCMRTINTRVQYWGGWTCINIHGDEGSESVFYW